MSAPSKRDAPRVGRLEARDDVEGRGLAGAVGADERQDLAAAEVEAEAVDGRQAAEAHRDVHAPRAPGRGDRSARARLEAPRRRSAGSAARARRAAKSLRR